MGFYDRDYQRDYYGRAPGFHLGSSLTLTSKIVIVMFGVYVVQMLTRGRFPNDGWFTDFFSLHADFVRRPWQFFELLSYGFLHDVWDIKHIIFNMLALWFFGRSVEYRYGKNEYLTYFLVAIVASGLVWALGQFIANRHLTPAQILGASGGIAAVVVLFCLNFPHQVLYVWGIFPVPVWVLGVIFVGQDLFGALARERGEGPSVAYSAHLGGAAFALLYFQLGWRLERLLPSRSLFEGLKPKPRLRVVDPDSADDSDNDADDSREAQVDAILQKIQEHGRDSLTRTERRILEEASREYQKRRR